MVDGGFWILDTRYWMLDVEEKAAALYDEIKTQYADAIDHTGKLLVDNIKAEAK